MNKKTVAISILIAILLAAAITETIFYYNGQRAEKQGIAANLVTKLGSTEEAPFPYNWLYIYGTVTNAGGKTAFNAGLHVVAFSNNGTLKINMTVPLTNGAEYGTDAATQADASSFGQYSVQLRNLNSGETATININIFHEGLISNWTIIPVWTNSA